MAKLRLRCVAGLASLGMSGSAAAQISTPGLEVPSMNRSGPSDEPTGDSAPVWAIGVTNSVTLSDNVFLAPRGSERSGTLLEVSPYAMATIDRPRQQAELTYRLRNFYLTPDSGYDGPRHDLRASGTVALKDDWLWLTGQAMVYDVSTSPFGVTAADPASRSGNRSRHTSYGILPYAKGLIDANTEYQAGYGLTYQKYGEPAVSSVAQHGLGHVIRDPQIGGLGWLGEIGTLRRQFDNDAKYETQHVSLGPLYRPTGSWRMGITADYARNSAVRSPSGASSGWGPGFLLGWTPSERTSFDFRASHAYYGNTAHARLHHRASRWSFRLDYERSIEDGGVAALTVPISSPTTRDPPPITSGNPNSADPMAGFVTPPAYAIVDGALVWSRKVSASVERQGLRNSGGVAVFRTRNESMPTEIALPGFPGAPIDLEQTGATARFDHKLTPRSSAALYASFVHSRSAGDARTSDLTMLTASWRYDLGMHSVFGIAYRRTEQRGEANKGAEYTENAVLAMFDFRF